MHTHLSFEQPSRLIHPLQIAEQTFHNLLLLMGSVIGCWANQFIRAGILKKTFGKPGSPGLGTNDAQCFVLDSTDSHFSCCGVLYSFFHPEKARDGPRVAGCCEGKSFLFVSQGKFSDLVKRNTLLETFCCLYKENILGQSDSAPCWEVSWEMQI